MRVTLTSRSMQRDITMEARTYEAYGGWWPTSDAVARTAYAGYVIEPDVSWYLLGPRFYVPWLRRFISPDVASPFDAGGFNRYAYGSGDPVNRIDPSGNASFGWLGRLLGHLIGTVTDAAGAVAQGTPTTALSAISRAAEVVSVATSIGAVTAAALDEAPAAGILGWIAGGSGLARLRFGRCRASHRENGREGERRLRPREQASAQGVCPYAGSGRGRRRAFRFEAGQIQAASSCACGIREDGESLRVYSVGHH